MHAWGFGNASHSLVWKTTWPRLRRKRLYSTTTLWVSYPFLKERETKPTRTQNHSLLFHLVVSTQNSLVMLSIYCLLTECSRSVRRKYRPRFWQYRPSRFGEVCTVMTEGDIFYVQTENTRSISHLSPYVSFKLWSLASWSWLPHI